MKSTITRNASYIVTGSVLLSSLLIGGVAFAQAPQGDQGGWQDGQGEGGGLHQRIPGVMGTVASISGNTMTVTSKGFWPTASPTTYTVDITHATVTKNNAASSIATIAVGDTVMVQGTVSGANVTATNVRDGVVPGQAQRRPGVVGIVASITGTTMTVTSKGFGQTTAPTTYTVDITSATITKDGATSSAASIVVGDTVMIQGTVSGTNVMATVVRDGVMPANQQPAIEGNGDPVVGGTVRAVNGAMLTLTNKSNVTYTIDATNAKIVKMNSTSTMADIAIGDQVVIQGVVNGNSVVASSVIDSGTAPTAGSQPGENGPAKPGGFIGGFGQMFSGFFHKLFGFF